MNVILADIDELKQLRTQVLQSFKKINPGMSLLLKNYKGHPLLKKLQSDILDATGGKVRISTSTLIKFFFDDTRLTFREETIAALKQFCNNAQQPDIALEYYHRGLICEAQHDYTGAFALYKNAYDINPNQLNYVKKYAILLREFGRLEESIIMFNRILETEIRLPDDELYLAADTYIQLAHAYDDLENITSALTCYEKAHQLMLSKFSKDSIEMVSLYNDMCSDYLFTGHYELSNQFNEHALAILSSHQHQKELLGVALKLKACIYKRSGDLDMSFKYMTNALDVFEAIEGHSKYRSDVFNCMGLAYTDLADYEKAHYWFVRAMQVDEMLWGPHTLRHLGHCQRIGDVLLRLGNYDEALKYAQRGIDLSVKIGYPDLLMVSSIYNVLAMVNWHLGKKADAKCYWDKSLDIKLCNYPADGIGLSVTYSNLAFYFMAIADYEKAELMFGNALDNVLKIYPDNHVVVGQIYNRLATLYRKKGDKDKSLCYAKKALPILKKYLVVHPIEKTVISSFNENVNWLNSNQCKRVIAALS